MKYSLLDENNSKPTLNDRLRASPFVLAGGYTAVWFAFAVLAALAQIVLTRATLLDSSMGFSVSRLMLTKFQLLRTAAPTEPEVVTEAEPEIAVQSTPLSLAAAHAIGSNGEGQSSV